MLPYNGPFYRPPTEAASYLIPVTEGCSHNSCNFCSMYRDIKFRPWSTDEIGAWLDHERARFPKYFDSRERIWLIGADPFALPAHRIIEVIDFIKTKIPAAREFTMYARADNVTRKSDEDLAALHAAGVTDVYIGVESGLDDVLTYQNKGYLTREIIEQSARLTSAGIAHWHMYMLGGAGAGRAEESGRAIAALENATHPRACMLNTITAFEGTSFNDDVLAGRFTMASEREILEEEITVLENLTVPTYFWAAHPLDAIRIEGDLPAERDELVADLKSHLPEAENYTISRINRTGHL